VKVKPKANLPYVIPSIFGPRPEQTDKKPASKPTRVKALSPISPETRFADLPDILIPLQVIAYTGLGRNRVYDLMVSNEIESKRVGQRLLTTKFALRRFLGVDVE
jgi:hypothetical protein